uniref:Histidinol-phosphate aminotransferase 1 n=1 Tax=Zeugodacus cucurbitae TaxID=28588 RepID=A0A0A1WXT6_ZEUCU
MRENLTTNMYNNFEMLRRDFNETVTKKTHEYTTLDAKIFAQLARLQRESSTEADFFLSPNISHLEVVYCIVALIILALIGVYLGDFVIGTRNRVITRYVLMSIIITISISSIFLCLFVIWHFLHGVVYYNYHREVNENEEFCNATKFHYCSLHNEVRSIRPAEDNPRFSVANYSVHDLCDNILDYNNKPETEEWARELNQQLTFFDKVYRSGAMFEVVRQELNMENWYELYNTLHSYNIGETSAEDKNTKQELLACNLNTIREYVFEQLFKRNIAANIFRLTQQSGNLRNQLPGDNLTRLIKRVLREAQELSDFCHTLENLLEENIDTISELLAKALMSFVAPLFEQFPHCDDLRFASLGVSREMYECIECSLHSFDIAAFGILIIIFIILLICIYLTIIYEKQAAIGVVRSSSLVRMRMRENRASDNPTGSSSNDADSTVPNVRKIFEKRPTRVRFMEPPRLKRRRLSKR